MRLGAVIGAIAIGATATSTLTTITISIATTILTATTSIEARDKVSGSTTHNTVATRLMVTGKQPTSLAKAIAARAEEGKAREVAISVQGIVQVAEPEIAQGVALARVIARAVELET